MSRPMVLLIGRDVSRGKYHVMKCLAIQLVTGTGRVLHRVIVAQRWPVTQKMDQVRRNPILATKSRQPGPLSVAKFGPTEQKVATFGLAQVHLLSELVCSMYTR